MPILTLMFNPPHRHLSLPYILVVYSDESYHPFIVFGSTCASNAPRLNYFAQLFIFADHSSDTINWICRQLYLKGGIAEFLARIVTVVSALAMTRTA